MLTDYPSVNVGWRSAAIQSSTYKSEKEWGAWKATDGPVTGLPNNKEGLICTQSSLSQKIILHSVVHLVGVMVDLNYMFVCVTILSAY